MADNGNGNNGGNNGAPQPEAPQVRMQVLGQYVRDLSFENIVAQKGIGNAEVQPDIQVQVSLDARKRQPDHQYEVICKYRVTSVNTNDRPSCSCASSTMPGCSTSRACRKSRCTRS